MTLPTPIPNHWLFTFPGRPPIKSPYRSQGGFRENCVRTSVGMSEYLSPFYSQWWEFEICRADAIGLTFPILARLTVPAEQHTNRYASHESAAIVASRDFEPPRLEHLILRVVDGRTWHATGRGTNWPPLPIPIPDHWPIFGVRPAGVKPPEIFQTMDEIEEMLRRELGDLPAAEFNSEGGLK